MTHNGGRVNMSWHTCYVQISGVKMNKEMEKLFNKKKKIISQLNAVGYKLDAMIDESWNFHYSDTDDDQIIDTLDYGTNNISYETFVEIMDEYKKNLDENGEFGCV